MDRPTKNWIWVTLILLVIGFFGALHIMDLRGEEPRRALVSWEMIQTANYWQPTIQGEPYYNKPPVFNWVVALFFQIFGYANWVVRVPSIVALLMMGAIHYRLVREWIGQPTALYSTLFLFTAVHMLFFATVVSGELDLFYALIVYLQAVTLFYFFQKEKWFLLFVISYLLVGLGFLTKGIPSIAFQGLTLLGMATYYGRWRWLFGWQHVLGALVGLLPVGLYFWGYQQQYGNAWLYLFNLLEEASKKSATEGKFGDILGQLVEFPLQFFVDYLPWAVLLIYLFRKKNRLLLREHPFLIFCVLFFAANIWIYWISPGSRNRYLYPFAPFFLTPLAYYWVQFRPIKQRWLLVLLLVLVTGRIVYNYTVMPYQQRTMKNIQLYRSISEQTLIASDELPVFSCCTPDTIYVDPSIGGLALLRDTIYIPMYLPYQIPFNIARQQDRVLPFKRAFDEPGIYLTTDSLYSFPGEILYSFEVWDEKTLRILKVKNEDE